MYALYSEDSTASTLANSGRHRRYIEAARKTAEDSTFPDYRHGALLVRGGSILNSAYNKNSHIGWANRFRAKSCGHATHHAELGAILGIDRAKSSGADVYVVRIGKNGELKLSQPCLMCQSVLAHMGVKRVYYSIDENNLGCIKL
tara:strand:- start:1903 stop:2337 length:435 start_codon:yes stop_codon:yes gene_type:complete